jgi:cytoskeletal protein RodZ
MKIKTKKKKSLNKKIPVIILVILLLAVGGTLVYVYAFHGTLFGQSKTTSPATTPETKTNSTDDQKSAGDSIKQTSVNSTQPTTTGTSDSTTGKTSTNVTITTAEQAGSTYQIRAQISAITNTGTCTLTLTKGSTVVTKTASVQALASTSTCEGFNIDTSELSSGNWQLLLKFENDSLTGSASQTITVT